AMAALIANCPNATAVPGILPTSLIDASTPLGATVPPLLTVNTDAIRAERLQKLAAGVNAWVETQGDLSATNILGAVIEGVSTRAAFVLFREARPRVVKCQ